MKDRVLHPKDWDCAAISKVGRNGSAAWGERALPQGRLGVAR